MTDSTLLDSLMHQALKDKVFPGGSVLVFCQGKVFYQAHYGLAQKIPQEVLLGPQSVFDIASLTKPVSTATLVMLLFQEGLIDLDKPVSLDLEGCVHSSITPRHLLCHTSGLPDWKPFYQKFINQQNLPSSHTRTQIVDLICREPLIHPVGAKTVYSDLGYIVLGMLLEKITGLRQDDLFQQKIAEPFRMAQSHYQPLPFKGKNKEYVPSEDCGWRQKVLKGEVMDDNAWMMQGIAGHAGLFSTVTDLYRWLYELWLAWRGESSFIKKSTFDLFCGLPSTRDLTQPFFALGFDTPTQPGSQAGSLCSSQTLGHLAFTGCSFWWDLKLDGGAFLLTNRTYPSRSNNLIKKFRPLFYDAVWTLLKQGR